jgi:hypothetical protein
MNEETYKKFMERARRFLLRLGEIPPNTSDGVFAATLLPLLIKDLDEVRRETLESAQPKTREEFVRALETWLVNELKESWWVVKETTDSMHASARVATRPTAPTSKRPTRREGFSMSVTTESAKEMKRTPVNTVVKEVIFTIDNQLALLRDNAALLGVDENDLKILNTIQNLLSELGSQHEAFVDGEIEVPKT